MTSLGDFVFSEALKIFQHDPLIMGVALIIFFAGLLFISRIPFTVVILFYLVLLDGFVGFNYTFNGESTGSFIDPLFFSFLAFGYLASLLVIGLGLIKAINK